MKIHKIWISQKKQFLLKVLVWIVDPNHRFQEIRIVSYTLINLNYIRKKLDLLSDHFKGNDDILMISETKINETFPVSHFKIDVFNTSSRVDEDQTGVGIVLHVREDLPAKLLSIDITNKNCFVELNLKRTKWLINYSFNPIGSNILSHLECIS